MGWRWLILVGSLFGCMACGGVISEEVRRTVAPGLTYTEVTARPEAHQGQVLIAAGTIITAVNVPEGTEFEVLQYPTSSRGRPQTHRPSGGRFIVRAPGYMETAVYRPGRAITVAGEVAGHLERPLGDTTYRYPVLRGREIYLWPPGAPSLPLHIGFGIGFGTRF